ncbi:MAG: RNA polymerase sigma factor, partial [Planctomycetes bacterium]|nr:RNA polymerase sigma factor [Planctomycetota bacterium]
DARAGELWEKYRTTGDPNTFNVLWLWIGNRVYPVLRGLLRTDDATEDGVQAVMVELLAKRDTMPTFDKAKAWLRAVATNIAGAKHRAGGRREAREQRVAKPDVAPDDHTARIIDQQAVRDALSQLDSADREIITLIHFERLTKEQAAAEVGCDPKTFANRLTAAESRLKELLTGVGVAVGTLTCADAVGVPLRIALDPERVAEMLSRAWDATASGATGWSKPLLATVGLLLCGGLALGGWVRLREPEKPPEQRPIGPDPVPVVRESVPERSLRIFERDVRPKAEAALKKLAAGDGDAKLESVEVFDCRVLAEFTVAHRPQGTVPWQSRVRVLHTPEGRNGPLVNKVWVSLNGRSRDFQQVYLDRPIVLAQMFGRELVLQAEPLRECLAAFEALPRDTETAREWSELHKKLVAALRPHAGDWYQNGNPKQPWRMVLLGTNGEIGLLGRIPDVGGAHPPGPGGVWMWYLNTAGELRGIGFANNRIRFAGDKIEFVDSGDVLVRTPAEKR